MKIVKKYFAAFPLALLLILPPAGGVRADERRIIPSVAVTQEYISNLFWTANNEQDDFINTVSPGLELVERTERLDARLRGVMDLTSYFEFDELNSVDHDYLGTVSYYLTPTLQVSGEAQYVKDSRTDRLVEETGLAVGAATLEREHYKAGGQWTVTEKTAVGLSYTYGEDDYDTDRFTSYDANTFTLDLTHNLGTYFPETVGLLNLSYTKYNFPTSTENYYALTIGAEKKLRETWSLLAYAGPRFTRAKYETTRRVYVLYPIVYYLTPTEETEKDWGVAANVDLKYKGEVTRASLAFSEDVLPATGSVGGTTTERSTVKFNITRRLTEKFRAGLFARFFRNKADAKVATIREIDENNFYISPRLFYEFTRDITLEARCSFAYIDDKVNNQNIYRNAAFVRLLFAYPLFE